MKLNRKSYEKYGINCLFWFCFSDIQGSNSLLNLGVIGF